MKSPILILLCYKRRSATSLKLNVSGTTLTEGAKKLYVSGGNCKPSKSIMDEVRKFWGKLYTIKKGIFNLNIP